MSQMAFPNLLQCCWSQTLHSREKTKVKAEAEDKTLSATPLAKPGLEENPKSAHEDVKAEKVDIMTRRQCTALS